MEEITEAQRTKAIDTVNDIAVHIGVPPEEVEAMVAEIIEKLTNAGISGSNAGKMLRESIKKISTQEKK